MLRVANARVGPGSTQYGGQAGLQTRVESIVDSKTHETELNTRSRQRAKGTRRDQLTKLLSRKSGASIAQIQMAFGWQPHTARAAISTLKKSGAAVERSVTSKGSVYRILAASECSNAGG